MIHTTYDIDVFAWIDVDEEAMLHWFGKSGYNRYACPGGCLRYLEFPRSTLRCQCPCGCSSVVKRTYTVSALIIRPTATKIGQFKPIHPKLLKRYIANSDNITFWMLGPSYNNADTVWIISGFPMGFKNSNTMVHQVIHTVHTTKSHIVYRLHRTNSLLAGIELQKERVLLRKWSAMAELKTSGFVCKNKSHIFWIL